MKNKAVGVIPINKRKKILLHLRDGNTKIYPNQWGLLGGGVKRYERPLSSLRRELNEEIGFNLNYFDAALLGILDDLRGNNCQIYLMSFNRNLNEINLNEGRKLGYFSLKEIEKMKNIVPPLQKFIIENKSRIFAYYHNI